jgi:hypothetical protein
MAPHHWPYNNREDKKEKENRNEIEDGWIRNTTYAVSLDIFFFLTNTQSLFLSPSLYKSIRE